MSFGPYTEANYLDGTVEAPYHRYNYFPLRGILLNEKIQQFRTNKVLIAGCGWGFLVEELMANHGFTDVWGCDASAYAVNTGKLQLAPAYQHRILQGDIRSASSMLAVANAAGIAGNNARFRAIVTENVLPCLSTAEIITALGVLRNRVQAGAMAHIITPKYRADNLGANPSMTWLWPAEWRALIGTSEPIYLSGSYEEVP